MRFLRNSSLYLFTQITFFVTVFQKNEKVNINPFISSLSFNLITNHRVVIVHIWNFLDTFTILNLVSSCLTKGLYLRFVM